MLNDKLWVLNLPDSKSRLCNRHCNSYCNAWYYIQWSHKGQFVVTITIWQSTLKVRYFYPENVPPIIHEKSYFDQVNIWKWCTGKSHYVYLAISLITWKVSFPLPCATRCTHVTQFQRYLPLHTEKKQCKL